MVKKISSSVTILHYGEYEAWNRDDKKLPTLLRITETVTARIDVEFGYTLQIKGQKGKSIRFIIEHPPFCDENGEISPSFTGEVFISSNNFTYYLGDCVWAPTDDKVGPWRLLSFIDDVCVADKTIYVVADNDDYEDNMDW